MIEIPAYTIDQRPGRDTPRAVVILEDREGPTSGRPGEEDEADATFVTLESPGRRMSLVLTDELERRLCQALQDRIAHRS